MSQNVIAILLLDNTSKKYIKSNVTELGLMGVQIINNFNEITDEMLQKCKDVVILEGYLLNTNAYSDIRLFKALLGINIIFMGVNDTLLSTVKEYGSIYHSNPTMLNFESIQGAVYQDLAIEEFTEEPKINSNSKSVALKIIEDGDTFDAKIRSLAKDYLNLDSEHNQLMQKLYQCNAKCDDLQNLNAKLSNENSVLIKGFADVMKSSVTLNKSLKEYERIMSQDIYNKVSLNNYSNKPIIIYFKEIEEILHENSFIETLFEVFRLQGRQSVKVLRLYDESNCRRVKSLPSYYQVIRNSYLISDITTSDFIVKVGNYSDVLDILLTNKIGLDILIIVDCKSYDDVVISGSPIYFNLCRNRANLEYYDIRRDNTIVSGCEDDNYLVWEHYDIYTQLSSKEERFLFLSSRPVIQSIFDLYRLIASSV